MNDDSKHEAMAAGPNPTAPILVVPYMWIGDFVRCHTVVRLLRARFPASPIDVLTTKMVAPLLDYMPGVRQGIVWDLPRKRLALSQHRALAARLRQGGYGRVLVMPRTWKSALAPFLAGIPERTGFAGELRFGLLNDLRWGERALPRMVDRCAALALPKGAPLPPDYPLPELEVPDQEIAAWRQRLGLAETAKRLAAQGFSVIVLGGPGETSLAAEIGAGQGHVRDLTGADLRNAILGLAAADVAVSNDSGLLHVAAAVGTPSIGIFGPTSPWHWAPLNPLAAVIETQTVVSCRPCHKPTCRYGHHRCMREIPAEPVVAAVLAARSSA